MSTPDDSIRPPTGPCRPLRFYRDQGRTAGQLGHTLNLCSYYLTSSAGEQWARGWVQGREERRA